MAHALNATNAAAGGLFLKELSQAGSFYVSRSSRAACSGSISAPHRLRDYRRHIRCAMGLAHRSNPPTRCVTFADELEARSP